MAAVLPTKGNLITYKRMLSLAQNGYELMDKKRNVLVREIMGMINDAEIIQSQIDAVFTQAYAALQIANITLGTCEGIAGTIKPDDDLDIKFRSVMGVELPTVRQPEKPLSMEYGFTYTNSALDNAYIEFNKVKALTRQLAEIEISIYRLAHAIKKTQKRANALKNIVIPNYTTIISTITDALEEKEREEFVRLKVIKASK